MADVQIPPALVRECELGFAHEPHWWNRPASTERMETFWCAGADDIDPTQVAPLRVEVPPGRDYGIIDTAAKPLTADQVADSDRIAREADRDFPTVNSMAARSMAAEALLILSSCDGKAIGQPVEFQRDLNTFPNVLVEECLLKAAANLRMAAEQVNQQWLAIQGWISH